MTYQLTSERQAEIAELLDDAESALDRFIEARGAKSVRRAIDQRIGALQTTIARIFRRQGNAVVRTLVPLGKYLNESIDTDFDKLFDGAILDTSSDMQTAIQNAIEAALLAGGKQLVSDFDASIVFSLTNPRAVQYTRQYAAKLITGIDDTTRNTIRQLLTVAIANGTPYSQLARQIKAQYKQFAEGVPQKHLRSRAELIAVTEIGNAYSEGNLISAQLIQKDGIPLEHYWQTVGDKRVSAGCRDNQAAGWIDLDSEFPSGHDRPLRFPGCRCTALYRAKR